MKFQTIHGDFQIEKKKKTDSILGSEGLSKGNAGKWSEKVGQNSHLCWHCTAFIRNVKEKSTWRAGLAPGWGLQEAAAMMAMLLPRQGFPGSISTFTCLSEERKYMVLKMSWSLLFLDVKKKKNWSKNNLSAQRWYLGNKSQSYSGDAIDVWWGGEQTHSKVTDTFKDRITEWNSRSSLNLLKFKVICRTMHRIPVVNIEWLFLKKKCCILSKKSAFLFCFNFPFCHVMAFWVGQAHHSHWWVSWIQITLFIADSDLNPKESTWFS